METIQNRTYKGIIIGIAVRGQIGHDKIFRVRRGNGFHDSILGAFYQDQYDYVVPASINNPESQKDRQQLIAAVHKWKFDLTAAQKKEYNKRATKGLRMSGYNLFMREAMKGLIGMYVDRGDPAAYDFVTSNFTLDAAWHNLDLSALITLGAKAVLLDFDYKNTSANRHIALKKGGQTNDFNHAQVHTRVAAQDDHASMICAVGPNRIIQYNIDAVGWTYVNMTLRGWWT